MHWVGAEAESFFSMVSIAESIFDFISSETLESSSSNVLKLSISLDIPRRFTMADAIEVAWERSSLVPASGLR